MLSLATHSEEETRKVAADLSRLLRPGDVVALTGMLGAGKTCFVKGLAEGLGIRDTAIVRSPTFVLINEYPTRPPLYHVDAYRLHSEEELEMIGIDEYFAGDGICVVEWADRVYNLLPEYYLAVIIKFLDAERRVLRLGWEGCRDVGRKCRLGSLLERTRAKLGQ